MGRSPCCEQRRMECSRGLNTSTLTVRENGVTSPRKPVKTRPIRLHDRSVLGLKRCGKSCRLRWLNYYPSPDIVRGNRASDEEELIIRLHKLLGNRLPGRTDRNKELLEHQLGQKGEVKLSPKWRNGRKPVKENIPKAVRTKALKCSSRVIVCPSSYQQPPDKDDRFLISGPNSISTPTSALGLVTEGKDKAEEGFSNAGVPSDLVMDFKIGDICLSELLSSDFWEATAAGGFDMLVDGSFVS